MYHLGVIPPILTRVESIRSQKTLRVRMHAALHAIATLLALVLHFTWTSVLSIRPALAPFLQDGLNNRVIISTSARLQDLQVGRVIGERWYRLSSMVASCPLQALTCQISRMSTSTVGFGEYARPCHNVHLARQVYGCQEHWMANASAENRGPGGSAVKHSRVPHSAQVGASGSLITNIVHKLMQKVPVRTIVFAQRIASVAACEGYIRRWWAIQSCRRRHRQHRYSSYLWRTVALMIALQRLAIALIRAPVATISAS